MTALTRATIEGVALPWLASLGWQLGHGPDIASDASEAEGTDYGQLVLERRLRDGLGRLNPHLPVTNQTRDVEALPIIVYTGPYHPFEGSETCFSQNPTMFGPSPRRRPGCPKSCALPKRKVRSA